jgi:phosphatidylethanolamine-binding protein (PEBP) family uncharacterized protein
MAFLNNDVLDDGLSVLSDDANRLDICSSEPSTYAEATSTLTLGNKTSYSVGAPEARTPDGRKVVAAAISDGDVTGTGTASHWAITDTSTSRLLAAGSLDTSQAVTDGNTFTIDAFDIGIPGPA